MRTWQAEMASVAIVLSVVAYRAGAGWVEWVGAAAVLAGFGHAQVADRLTEHEARRSVKAVACYRWSRRYFVAKELLWLVYFVTLGAWSALAGVVVFLLYPAWRDLYRRNLRPFRSEPWPGGKG